ncbi:MAG: hypothetical protein U0821_03720 [Chloroflexota bacterium]
MAERAVESPEDVLALLRSTSDRLRRRLILAAWLNARLGEVGGRVAVVGGSALEVYTRGGYATADLDLVTVDRALVGEHLESLGFRRDGRYWVCDDLDLLVEVPGEQLRIGGSPGDWDRATSADVPGVGAAWIIGVEDLIVDRLLAAKYWHDEAALHWARTLLAFWTLAPGIPRLDLQYLSDLARRELVDDVLALPEPGDEDRGP